MCEPVTIAGLVLSAVTTAVSMNNQNKAAAQQQRAINEGWLREMEASNVQQQQINSSAAEQQLARVKMARQEIATARVGAGESGIGGLLAARLESEPAITADADIATIEANRQAGKDQNMLERDSRSARAQSERNKVRYGSRLGAGLQIASSAASAYQSTQPKR